MNQFKRMKAKSRYWAPLATLALWILFVTGTAQAAVPGISGPTFHLVASTAYVTQPDGAMLYSWGYGCDGAPSGFLPSAIAGANCEAMQVPGPTLIVTEGDTVTVILKNNLPAGAGNTSILFPGFQVTSPDGEAGLLAHEAPPGGTVTYTFTAISPGTRPYYSGTRGDLQVEMGLYGAIIVLPNSVPASCDTGYLATQNQAARTHWGEADFRLAHAAYDHDKTCYDREYLFQFSEMDPEIHRQAMEQQNVSCSDHGGCMQVATEPYRPAYFMINGRSAPDDMDPNYSPHYPHQPYNGNPHLHPGELVLVRVIGTGRWQHPFHEHGNHLRTLARDANLILSQSNSEDLAGPLLFTTTTTPGQSYDGIFQWTGKGLNWDVYGHGFSGDASACTPDPNGYYTGGAAPNSINYFEWCDDHNKPLEKAPFGNVGSGGPVTLPDPNLFANGAWYGGSPYLGPDATVRAVGPTGTTPPSGTVANPPDSEAAFGFMWHSHNERELTTNNIFPGGMMMIMLVDSREFKIDETK